MAIKLIQSDPFPEREMMAILRQCYVEMGYPAERAEAMANTMRDALRCRGWRLGESCWRMERGKPCLFLGVITDDGLKALPLRMDLPQR